MSTIYLIVFISIALISVVSSAPITNLTQSHRGCGPVGIDVTPILQFVNQNDITPCCIQHDACYSSCNTTKIMCDNDFLTCSQNACGSKTAGVTLCNAISCGFYDTVKRAGGFSYAISQIFAKCSKTSADPSMTAKTCKL